LEGLLKKLKAEDDILKKKEEQERLKQNSKLEFGFGPGAKDAEDDRDKAFAENLRAMFKGEELLEKDRQENFKAGVERGKILVQAIEDAARAGEMRSQLEEKQEKKREQLQKKFGDLQEKRAKSIEKANRPLGGFDRGLDAISSRIADAASKTDENDELERLSKQQLEVQGEIAKHAKESAIATAKLEEKIRLGFR